MRSFHNVMSLILFALASTYAVLQVLGGKPDPNTWNSIAWVILLFTAFNSASRVLPEDITSVRSYMHWTVPPRTMIVARTLHQSIIMSLLSTLLLFALGLFLGSANMDTVSIFGFLAGMVLSLPITAFLYTLIEGLTGASPAKMMFGIKIANEDGTKANRNTLIKRWAFRNGVLLIQILAAIGLTFLSQVSLIYGLIIIVGCFMVLRDNKQSFHDSWSTTAVFKKSDIT